MRRAGRRITHEPIPPSRILPCHGVGLTFGGEQESSIASEPEVSRDEQNCSWWNGGGGLALLGLLRDHKASTNTYATCPFTTYMLSTFGDWTMEAYPYCRQRWSSPSPAQH
ncbi:hypothetical protein CaCOL14_013066 [Colletotrichum acutatum]